MLTEKPYRENTYLNGSIVQVSCIQYDTNSLRIYEVIRISNKVPLFLENHIERLLNSIAITGYSISYTEGDIKNVLFSLLEANHFADGNVKMLISINPDNIGVFAFYIKHNYPSNDLYSKGVKLQSLKVERENPNAKVIHDNIKIEVDKILSNNNIYEVALINYNNIITEGSRSNLFFINNNNEVETAPVNLVLPGITRKYIFECCKNLSINVIENNIDINTLTNYKACFMSGTSPKVLPINSIDSIKFEVGNVLIKSILTEYGRIVNLYIKNFNW